uniref:Retinoid-inducible serine carboxypeptidase n=1 Tax=Plectus sambesii TaxID=2011161 RepID=A0A914VFJ8_9BILA
MRFTFVVALFSIVLYVGSNAESVNTFGGVVNYDEKWGYTTVRSQSHTFWWLYAASNPSATRPLILWLQGGPGASGTGFGNFFEVGPKDIHGNDNNATWLQVGDLVFVDNPVGTGFSYVESLSALAKTNQQIGADLVAWATDFFTLHSEYATRPFYIFCESYGGKMSAEFASQLQTAIGAGKIRANFRGVALGDSWISPMDYVNTWGPYLKSLSFLDDKDLARVNTQAQHCQSLVNQNQWSQATDCWGNMENLIGTVTNGVSWYNVLKRSDTDDWSRFEKQPLERLFDTHVSPLQTDATSDYMNGPVRQKLGIIPKNVQWGGQANNVFSALEGDFMKPVITTVDNLLKAGVRVFVFNGQVDLICDTLGTEAWVNKLTWPGLAGWNAAARQSFHVGSSPESYQTAGFVKQYQNFQFWFILRAGHMVAYDAKEAAVYMLKTIAT